MQQMQQQRLKQQQALMQQSLYHPGLFAPPQIEPILSGNLPPGFDSSTCRSVYVGNIHTQISESLLQEVFSNTGPLEGCKLIRKESSYGFVDYFDRRSAAFSIVTLNGRHIYSGSQLKLIGHMPAAKERIHQVTSAPRLQMPHCTLVFPCILLARVRDARVMWDQKTGRSRGFGFVSFRSQQDAQSAINVLTGKWLGSRQIRCNWAAKGAGTDDNPSSDSKSSVVELTHGTSDDGQEKANDDAPENNPQYTTVYVGNLAPEVTSVDLHRHFHLLGVGVIVDVSVQREKGFGFVRFSNHAEAARAIQSGNARILFGKPIKCLWGSKPTPLPGMSSTPLMSAYMQQQQGLLATDLAAACERQIALSKMGGAHSLMMHQQDQRLGATSQAIYDGGFTTIPPAAAAAQLPMYYQ